MTSAADHDGLVLLRQSIAASQPFIPSASADASAPEVPLAQATHLRFPEHTAAVTVPIDSATRFVSNDKSVDLRSIYFAWLNREVAIPEYNASATKLNDELGAKGKVQNLGFIERLDLITWLEGASEESEYIKPLAGDKDGSAAGAATAAKAGAVSSAAQARSGRGTMDPRLASIYNGERKMGDRNTILRGIKPTDFSHVRKLAAPFIQKKSQSSGNSISANPTLALNQKAPSRRPDPIILLSPSASSLLRLSNARSFLEDGKFGPPEAGDSTATMLHVQRTIKAIDPNRPLRFILVEGSEQFKPEYWNRVVAVFTTGQTWQFKNYKWSDANELFKHTLGIYVGWRGDVAPDNVQGWGHRVLSTGVDRWRGEGHDDSRFRDKEIVEQIWKSIEANMRSRGWRKDAAPASI
ncbi:accessory factor associated with RNA polymerase II [Neonectria punicea]|uniref:Accessory factor associated with RNA polymerase II n=1 Tax=Neonectria punicea TaxID=979145 RepID=A0ABR1GII2_9HYPO